VREMVRVVDLTHPEAKIVLVQGAPTNALTSLWNQVCAPLLNEAPDHQGYLPALAAEILAATGFE
ncbi:hypothetical protein, partial [Microbacterium sp. HSID17254]|uniref:hypothetical protein n=1 Tax=Microbacterium sp. HSID17254 TaxID=2419509 RepID=UPI001EE8D6C5